MSRNAAGIGDFMNGFMRGGSFTLAARDKLGELKDNKVVREEAARVAKVNAEERARRLAELGGTQTASAAPAATSNAPAATPATAIPTNEPAAEEPANGLAAFSKKYGGENVRTSDRRYDGTPPATPEEAPAAAIPEAPAEEDTAKTSPYTHADDAPSETAIKEGRDGTDADANAGITPEGEEGYKESVTAKREALTPKGKIEDASEAIDEDATMTQPAGEPPLTKKALETSEPIITSDNTPTKWDQNAAKRAAIRGMPSDATPEQWHAADMRIVEQTRQHVTSAVGESISMIRAAEAMPEGPDKMRATNAVRVQLAEIWGMLPNGMSARVEKIGDKYILMQYSDRNPNVKMGRFIVSAESLEGIQKQFTGPDGMKNWGDWDLAQEKQTQEVRQYEQIYEHRDFKLNQDAYAQSVTSLMLSREMDYKERKEFGDNVQRLRLGSHADSTSQGKAVENYNKETADQRKLYTARNAADYKASRESMVANPFIDGSVAEPPAVINDTLDNYYNSTNYVHGNMLARDIVKVDAHATAFAANWRAALTMEAAVAAEKQIQADGVDTGSAAGNAIRRQYWRSEPDTSSPTGYTTHVYDPTNPGASERIKYPSVESQLGPKIQKERNIAAVGGKGKMAEYGLKMVPMITPTGDTVMQLAAKSYTPAQQKKDVAANTKMLDAQPRKGAQPGTQAGIPTSSTPDVPDSPGQPQQGIPMSSTPDVPDSPGTTPPAEPTFLEKLLYGTAEPTLTGANGSPYNGIVAPTAGAAQPAPQQAAPQQAAPQQAPAPVQQGIPMSTTPDMPDATTPPQPMPAAQAFQPMAPEQYAQLSLPQVAQERAKLVEIMEANIQSGNSNSEANLQFDQLLAAMGTRGMTKDMTDRLMAILQTMRTPREIRGMVNENIYRADGKG